MVRRRETFEEYSLLFCMYEVKHKRPIASSSRSYLKVIDSQELEVSCREEHIR